MPTNAMPTIEACLSAFRLSAFRLSTFRVVISFVIDNERIVCRRAIAKKFNEYFCSIASNMNEKAVEDGIPVTDIPAFDTYLKSSQMHSIFLSETSNDEISDIMSELHKNKASDIPIILIKRSSHIIVPHLTKLYNSCINSGTYPDEFKLGKITPIFKKGNTELMENYRPVSTLPIFGKNFEKIFTQDFIVGLHQRVF